MIRGISQQILQLPSLSPAVRLIIRLMGLGIIDIATFWLAAHLADDGNWFLAGAIVVTTLLVNIINLFPTLAPVQWMTPSLALITLFALYPLIYTIYVSLTNYQDGHRYTKQEAIELLEQRRYLPAGAVNYYWSPYVDEDGKYALWLISAEDGTHYFAEQGEPIQKVVPNESGTGPYTSGERQFPDGLPLSINGYQLAQGPAFFQVMQVLDPKSGSQKDTRFGDEDNPIGISGRSEAGDYQLRWVYDKSLDAVIDHATYVEYKADANTGTFVAADGSVAPVDFRVPFDNSDTRRSKSEAIALLQKEYLLPSGKPNYQWTAYRNTAGAYALWLVSDRDGKTYIAYPDQPLQLADAADSPPESIEDYQRLNSGATMQALTDPRLVGTRFGDAANPIIVVEVGKAGNYRQRWVYDTDRDVLTDTTHYKAYFVDKTTGDFIAADGSRAPLGFWVFVGLKNFDDALTSSLIDGPLLRVFLWTVTFAFFSVLTAFAMGLLIALILNDGFPGVRIVRSLLLIPWAIPGMIGILIWRGMLNGLVGVIPTTMRGLFGDAPPFFTDPLWAKFSILLVNLWFAYPYFMLISSGALQSIPSSIYEAAEVDGANAWNKFWGLTLPLLLVSMGPLLIASFIFNFNNFLLIEGLTEGGPQIQGTNAPPVGHTDNLMTYTYRYAFSSGGTRNFGFASAIAVMIFVMVALLTLVQFRLTKRWEEIGENV